MTILLDEKYLCFPVKIGAEKKTVEMLVDGEKVLEYDIEIAESDFDFYGFLCVEKYLGKTMEIVGDFSNDWAERIQNRGDILKTKDETVRPRIHFTAKRGWINDPNGCVFHDGIYHLYFQHNPMGTAWGNMTWGHTQSTDLVHWEQKDDVLYPDSFGAMFSGCAVIDEKNLLGYGQDALLFYYTAAGSDNQWSRGKGYTQRLAYSIDGGKTLEKSDRFVMEEIAHGNRDPKIFYHHETEAYIMVLYLDENDFAIFRSRDLLNWEETQRLTFPKMWECPGLFCISVDGDPEDQRWVFWSADGFYHIGSFDGYRFISQSERLCAYATSLPYAAQTYFGTGERVINQSWLRTSNHGKLHTGIMGIPMELTLADTAEGLRIRQTPVKEIEILRKQCSRFKKVDLQTGVSITIDDTPAEVEVHLGEKIKGIISVSMLGHMLYFDLEEHTITFGKQSCRYIPGEKEFDFRIFIDYDVVEILAADNTVYMACEWDVPKLIGEISLVCDSNVKAEQVDIYTLYSMTD